MLLIEGIGQLNQIQRRLFFTYSIKIKVNLGYWRYVNQAVLFSEVYAASTIFCS